MCVSGVQRMVSDSVGQHVIQLIVIRIWFKRPLIQGT